MNYTIIDYRYQVLGIIQESNSKFQSVKISKFLSFKVSKFQSSYVSKFPSFKVPSFQVFQVSKFQDSKIPRLQGSKNEIQEDKTLFPSFPNMKDNSYQSRMKQNINNRRINMTGDVLTLLFEQLIGQLMTESAKNKSIRP